MQILVTKHTQLEKTDRVFSISSEDIKCSADGTVIKLEDLQSLVAFQKVTCSIKVTNVDDPLEVLGGKKKQDILIADDTGTAR